MRGSIPPSLAPLPSPRCVVCGSVDGRTLTTTPLASGALVIVCGGHAVAHARMELPARTARELASMLRERRDRDRRDSYRGEVDELAAALAAGFAPDRRRIGRRRGDAELRV